MHPGAKVAGRYTIESVVSNQSMGSVFKARDRNGQLVAIKSLHRDASTKRERFSREMETLQDLEHPAIVRYLDSGTNIDGTPYFVMEWLAGQDLASVLRAGPLTLGETLTWSNRIAEALAVAHARGIVHRDVKPSNIFLPGGDVGSAKLIDFGIAFVAGSRNQLTATGVMMGTPAYMAPEQARGERDIDTRADVFSLGCVLYESLTGNAPFVANTPMAVLGKILVEPSPLLRHTMPDIPEVFDQLVAGMMAKTRENRPESGAHVATELDRIGSQLGANPERWFGMRHERPSVLTRAERRWVSAIVVAAGPSMAAVDPSKTGATVELADGHRPSSHSLSLGGAMFEKLSDGSMVNIVEVRGAATDQASSAAQLALVFRREFPAQQVAVATGRALMRGGRMAGDVIDRAADILRQVHDPGMSMPAPAAVWVDELTAELLDGRFEIFQHGTGIMLSGRRRTFEERTLLGRSTPFVGRRREFSALVATLEECVEEEVAHAVLVTGPPGFGKSRLMHELLRYLDSYAGQLDVWIGQGDPMHEGSSLFAVADAIRRNLDISESASVGLRQAALRTYVQQTVGLNHPKDIERICDFMAELLDMPIEQPSLRLRAARQDPRLMGDQIQRACGDLIAARCRSNPVVLIIDDLQWSDRATVALLDRMLRNLQDASFMVIAFGRLEIHERFPRIWAERSLTELRLGPITKRAAEKLARTMLGSSAEDSLVSALVQRAGGNAFYLEELLRSASSGQSEWPESVLAMVEMRIEALEVQARQCLRAASVFGSVFWLGGVRALLGSEDTEEWLERLVERELVSESRSSRFAGEREYRFRHALVREGAYAMLTDDDRTLGHRLAAQWLEAIGEPDPRVIAEQFERGQVLERALPYFARAAEDAFELSDLDVALSLAERGVACGAEGQLLGHLCQIRATIHAWQGKNLRAAELFGQSMALLTTGSRGWYDAAGEAAVAWSKLGDADGVGRVATALESLGDTASPTDESASADDSGTDDPGAAASDKARAEATEQAAIGRYIAFAKLSRSLFEVGPREQGASMLEKVRAAAQEYLEDPLLAAYVHYASARYFMELVGDPARALREMECVLQQFEILGDTRQVCNQRANLGYSKMELGLYQEAVDELQSAMATAASLGLNETRQNARRLLSLAIWRSRPDKLADAFQLAREAEAWFNEHDHQGMVSWTRLTMAGMMMSKGDHDSAAQLARASRSASYSAIAATALLSRIELARGHVNRALSTAEDAAAMYQLPGHSEEDAALVYLAHAEALFADGSVEHARTLIHEARDELLARAAKIGNPAWRASFLENIPVHARIVQLADTWS